MQFNTFDNNLFYVYWKNILFMVYHKFSFTSF